MKSTRRKPRIIASGRAISKPFEGDHWENPRRKAWYVNIKWDSMLDPSVEPPLPRDELDRGVLGKVHWNTQRSGIVIPDDAADALELVWRKHLQSLQLAPISDIEPDIDEPAGREGKIKLRLHKARERDPHLRERKKAQALRERGQLKCEVCDFVFAAIYGPLGRLFIECHHTTPMAEFRGTHKITLDELALVCANCHRMLHRSGLKPIRVLRAIVLKNRAPT